MAYRFTAVIADRAGFILESYGNGAAYRFQHTASCRDVWLQGDDAAQFREELEALEAMEAGTRPGKLKDALAWLWDEMGYGDVSQAMPEIPQ